MDRNAASELSERRIAVGEEGRENELAMLDWRRDAEGVVEGR